MQSNIGHSFDLCLAERVRSLDILVRARVLLIGYNGIYLRWGIPQSADPLDVAERSRVDAFGSS